MTESYLDNIASQVPGLKIALWHKDRNDGRRTEQVVADDQEARAEGIHVTPAYRLGRTGGPLKNFVGSEAITFPRPSKKSTRRRRRSEVAKNEKVLREMEVQRLASISVSTPEALRSLVTDRGARGGCGCAGATSRPAGPPTGAGDRPWPKRRWDDVGQRTLDKRPNRCKSNKDHID